MFGRVKAITVKVLIGEKTKLEGNILSEDAIKVDGELVGNIITTREVIIGATGHVMGDIACESLVIAGTVEGNVKANGQLAIHATGTLRGNARAASLVIEEGGVFNGLSEGCAAQDTDGQDAPA